MINWIKDILNLFFPELCYGCRKPLEQKEKGICLICKGFLPTTNFHLTKNNKLKEIFFGRIKLKDTAVLFYFSKGGYVQNILHNLKYKGHQDISFILGDWLGNILKDSNKLLNVDCVISVPLHKKKYRKRGYNQVMGFAKNLAKFLNADYEKDNLIRITYSDTQTKKQKFDRWKNVCNSFQIKNKKKLKGKHILLVDDVITTGATMEACCIQLQKIEGITISIGCMAITNF